MAEPMPGRFGVLHGDEWREYDLYDPEALPLLASLWTRASWNARLSYEPTWLGFPVIQMPEDLVMLQEMLHRVRPDVVIETGTAHGGSAIFAASILRLLGAGRVVSVDVEIRKYNRLAIQSDPLADRIRLIEGSSVDPSVAEAVREEIRPGEKVAVMLDSRHTRDHVAAELRLYAPLVSEGSYLVVFDGVMEAVADAPRGNADWTEDNPEAAVREFLADHPEFTRDPYYNRLRITHCPGGFLRREGPSP